MPSTYEESHKENCQHNRKKPENNTGNKTKEKCITTPIFTEIQGTNLEGTKPANENGAGEGLKWGMQRSSGGVVVA